MKLYDRPEFLEGYKAYCLDLKRSDNPYTEGKEVLHNLPAELWEMGWEEAWLDGK